MSSGHAIAFVGHPYIIATVALISWPIYTRLAKLFFGESYESFAESIQYFFQWDWVSLWKGQYWDDEYATFKLKFFLFACFAWVAAVAEIVCRVFL